MLGSRYWYNNGQRRHLLRSELFLTQFCDWMGRDADSVKTRNGRPAVEVFQPDLILVTLRGQRGQREHLGIGS
jgi:hypothetical protein